MVIIMAVVLLHGKKVRPYRQGVIGPFQGRTRKGPVALANVTSCRGGILNGCKGIPRVCQIPEAKCVDADGVI